MKTMIKNSAFAAGLLLALASAACGGDDKADAPSEPKLSVVTDDVMKVPYTGSDALKIEFICNGDWTAELTVEGDDKSWIDFAGDKSGKGNGAVELRAEANTKAQARNASVTLTSGTLTARVSIAQDPKLLNITFKHPSVAFTQEQLDKIRAGYAAGAPSLVEAVNFIFTRAAGGLSYNVETVTDENKRRTDDMATLYKSLTGPTVLALNMALALKLKEAEQEELDKYGKKIAEIIYDWAEACKDVEYPVDTQGGTEDDPATGAGMYLSRAVWPFFVCYDMLHGTGYISAAQDVVIEAWFRSIVKHIKASMSAWELNDYYNKQYWQNHLAAHMWGLLTIGYVLEDASLVQYAIDSPENPRDFYELIQGSIFMEGDEPCHRERAGAPAVQTGEIYDRYRHDTGPLKGLQYSSLTLQMLSTAARTCYNNGIDMYAYTAPTGENLRLAYEFYADFYATGDTSIKGGYYTGEDDRITKAGDMQGLYELGYNAYPDSRAIKSVIDAIPNRAQNKVQMHEQLGYTRLYSIDADAAN